MTKAHKKVITDPELSSLAAAVAAYLSKTATYAAWNAMSKVDDKIHAIINIYRKGSSSHVNIRPAITPCEGIVHNVEKVLEMSRHIRAMDTQNRPENQQAVRDNLPVIGH
jgi:hypothetical protein